MFGRTYAATASQAERRYYQCRSKDCILTARPAACPSRNVKTEEIEGAVWDHAAGLLADPDRLLAQFDHFAATAEAGSARDQAAEQHLRARLDRTTRDDKRLLDAYEAGAITLPELSERRRHLAEERRELERQQQERDRLRQQRVQAQTVRTADSDETGQAFQSEAGHLFRDEAGRRSDLKPATSAALPGRW